MVTDANGKEITSPNHIGNINPIRYRGYYYDTETDLYYLQSRYYNPELCRFISNDDFTYIDADTPMSVNSYIYCFNSPITFSDQSGHLTSSEKNALETAASNSYYANSEVRNAMKGYSYMDGSYSASFEKKYKIITVSRTYKSNSNYRQQLGIVYRYGLVKDIRSLAMDYQNAQKNNLDRRVEFIKLLGAISVFLFPLMSFQYLK